MGEKDHLKIKIGNRLIGSGEPAYLIAEMSANHAGSIERAKEIIHAAKESGADCIKIQTYTPDTLTIDCHNKYFQVNNGTWEGENLYSLYGKAYTPWEWQPQLKAEADKVGIDFLSTPFDNTAVDFLEDMGLEFYKIASFEMIDLPLVEYVASKGKPNHHVYRYGYAGGDPGSCGDGISHRQQTAGAVKMLQRLSRRPGADVSADDYRYAETFRPAHWSVGSFHGFHECCDGGGPGGIGY